MVGPISSREVNFTHDILTKNYRSLYLPSSKVVYCLRSLGKRPEADGLLEQGLSGEEDGRDRRRCRPTPNVANSTTTGVETIGALMDVVLSVEGALVNRIGLTKGSSGATTSGQVDDPECWC